MQQASFRGRGVRLIAALALVVVAALATSTSALAQADPCEPIYKANADAKAVVVGRIEDSDAAFKAKVSAARACIEQFGLLAARGTILLGSGFDLTLLQNALVEAACNVLQTTVNRVVPVNVATAVGVVTGVAGGTAPTLPTTITTPAALPSAATSVWDQLRQMIFN